MSWRDEELEQEALETEAILARQRKEYAGQRGVRVDPDE